MAEKPRTPSIAISLLPVVTLVIMLAVAIYIFRGDSLGGASQIVLLIATSICSLIAVFHCKIKWEDIYGFLAAEDSGDTFLFAGNSPGGRLCCYGWFLIE